MENEAKYTLVRSHRGAYSQEFLYVTQHEERITSLVLWSEDAETLSIVELKGNIQLDNVDEIANALKVAEHRWQNLLECHELYCAGHMMEAAVAYYEATGKDKLLKVMEGIF